MLGPLHWRTCSAPPRLPEMRETMEKTQIETSMLGRKVRRTDLPEPKEGTVVAAWIQTVIQGRDGFYDDGYRVTRVFFLLEGADGSFWEVKANDCKAAEVKHEERAV